MYVRGSSIHILAGRILELGSFVGRPVACASSIRTLHPPIPNEAIEEDLVFLHVLGVDVFLDDGMACAF